jgi:hypothetical protein
MHEEWTTIDRSIRTRHFQQRDLHIYFLTYHDDCLDCWTLYDGKILMDHYTQEEDSDGEWNENDVAIECGLWTCIGGNRLEREKMRKIGLSSTWKVYQHSTGTKTPSRFDDSFKRFIPALTRHVALE